MMFVQSSRPPSPTSMTAMSTCCLAKWLNAMAVVISKKDGWSRSMSGVLQRMKLVTACFEMGRPLMRMRSRKSRRCGEV